MLYVDPAEIARRARRMIDTASRDRWHVDVVSNGAPCVGLYEPHSSFGIWPPFGRVVPAERRAA